MLRKPIGGFRYAGKLVLATALAATPAAVVFMNDLRDNLPCTYFRAIVRHARLLCLKKPISAFVY